MALFDWARQNLPVGDSKLGYGLFMTLLRIAVASRLGMKEFLA